MNSSSLKSNEILDPSNKAERVDSGVSGLGAIAWISGVLAPDRLNGEEVSEREIVDGAWTDEDVSKAKVSIFTSDDRSTNQEVVRI